MSRQGKRAVALTALILAPALLMVIVWFASSGGKTVGGSEQTYYGVPADRAMAKVDENNCFSRSRAYISITLEDGSGMLFRLAEGREPEDIALSDHIAVARAVEQRTGLPVATKITALTVTLQSCQIRT